MTTSCPATAASTASASVMSSFGAAEGRHVGVGEGVLEVLPSMPLAPVMR